jgi:Uma2 family endonuclease
MTYPARLVQYSVEEYLEMEEKSEVRHEYVAGQIFAMAGATEAHNLIAGNIYALLRPKLRRTGCRIFIADMKTRIEAVDAFYYPDVMATCEPFVRKSVFKSRPFLIVEVLSPSTTAIDRREKQTAYGKLDRIREYAIVHQDSRRIELHRKDDRGKWQTAILGENNALVLESLPAGPITLTMDEIYEDVIFPAGEEEDEAD